jgi:hypothetical protein
MSDRSSLSELARFVGQSRLSSSGVESRQRTINSAAAGVKPKLQRHSVTDLLGVVLVLSARTRRAALPKVEIDLDAFTPEGRRAVRMMLRP